MVSNRSYEDVLPSDIQSAGRTSLVGYCHHACFTRKKREEEEEEFNVVIAM